MTIRVFVPPGAGPDVRLDPQESHYLVRVRRARAGQAIEALDGTGGRWHARVHAADPRAAHVALGPPIPAPPVVERVVLLAMPERAALLQALDHALCLGASHVWLLRCERSAQAPPGPGRIERTLRAAMRQCGRAHPMAVDGPRAFDQILPDAPGRRLVASPGAAPPSVVGTAPVSVLVGPEGGLTPGELALARDAGFEPVGLGPWILRTPLAVAAALARLTPCAPDARA